MPVPPPNNSSRPKAVRSMTGFASVRKQTSGSELTVMLRSVNHRGLDLHFYLGGEFAAFENDLRTLLKEKLGRGHVEIRLALTAPPDAERGGYNRALLARHLLAFRDANIEFGLDSTPDLNRLLTIPGVLENGREVRNLDESFGGELMAAMSECAAELNAFREREGQALVGAIREELASVVAQSATIVALRSQALPRFAARLRERLQALLSDLNLPESRLLEEAAILADRSDVQEELTRLEVHSRELGRLLDEGGEIGKRLDFLLQEMNRETNTVLSKSSGIGEDGLQITGLGLAVKANIERIREQALNLE